MTIQEPSTVGLTKAAHDKLKRFKDDGCFGELQDAYRFAISLAVAQELIPHQSQAKEVAPQFLTSAP